MFKKNANPWLSDWLRELLKEKQVYKGDSFLNYTSLIVRVLKGMFYMTITTTQIDISNTLLFTALTLNDYYADIGPNVR